MEVYIVLTKTGTILSNIIRVVKNHHYTHVSISLDKNLKKMYSFGRLNPYNAFVGGFVHEGVNVGTFKRFKNTECMVLKLKVLDSQYETLSKNIDRFKKNYRKYEFNVWGLFLVLFNKRKRRRNKFYCAEFVKYVLDRAKIENNLPSVVTPNDFLYLDDIKIVYEGKLREYCNN